ncbi:hypothetical protein BD560DRAFT_446758 [Blakeslea trispora]|nr:hypothetical protein BD560DRAFT_446758 [Blakeslea trispora]
MRKSKHANQVVAQEGLTTKRGRPFGTTKATLVKSHSSNQSRMTSFLSNQDNAMISNQNAKDLVSANSSDDSFIIADNSADINSKIRTVWLTDEPVEEEQSSRTSEGRVIDDFEEELLDDLDEEIIEQMDREAGLVEESSAVDRYLKTIQDKIKEDNKKDALRSPRPPKEYRNGTFWVHRKDPAFALRDQLESSPEILYQPRIFLWFPHHLVSDPKCPKCTIPTKFFVKEWNTHPRARRITDTDELRSSTMADCIDRKNNNISSYDNFSHFCDKKKYPGYISCSNFLSHAYSLYIEEFVPFMDQSNLMLDGVILKGDHSFKIIKHMGKTNGTSVFSSLYTIMNEYDETRMQVLAHTKSLKELSGSFESMMDGYRSYGFEMLKVFYTDNVMADKNTLEAYISSLSENVRAILVDKTAGSTTLSNNTPEPLALPEHVKIKLLDDVEGINEACQVILDSVSESSSKQVLAEIDCEWVAPNFRTTAAPTSHVALVQIYHQESETKTIERHMQYSSQLSSTKNNDVRLSNWEALELSDQQKHYAALNAYAAVAVYNSVEDMQLVNEPVSRSTCPGTFVGGFPKNSSKLIAATAFGYIYDPGDEGYFSSVLSNIFVPTERGNMVLVKFVEVKRPGYILEKYRSDETQQGDSSVTLEMFGDAPFFAFVQYKCLRTALEATGLKKGTVEPPNSVAELQDSVALSAAVSALNDDLTLQSSCQVPVSLRHGMAKDFKRRFRDCLFAVNQEDKRKVEEYLTSIGSDWDMHLVNNLDLVWERDRESLFNKESLAASKRMMDQIKTGYVSDVVDGPPLYTEKGLDKNGLMRYSCSRGTSSVAGSCHFNIIRKFSSFNAGLRLTNTALSDYRLYHNINMGSKNRYGLTHKSHYSPWLAQSIDILRSKVGRPVRTDSYFDNNLLRNTYLCGHTTEKFGITPIPSHVKIDYLMKPYNPLTYFKLDQFIESNTIKTSSSQSLSKKFLEEQTKSHSARFTKSRISEERIFKLSTLPIVKLPNIYYASHQFIYRYLSKCQGTKYAVTAVHTPQEKALFSSMLSDSTENAKYVYLKSSNGSVNFGLMAAAWSKLCSPSKYIYYKTPEHLYSYYNILEDRKKYRDTVAYNIDASRSIRLLGQCKRRYVSSEQAKKYRRLEPSLLTCTSIVSTSTTEVAKEAPVNIAPRPSAIEPPIEIVEPIVITRIDQTTEALSAFS